MDSTMIHICLADRGRTHRWRATRSASAGCAPAATTFVYREGFNRAGYPSVEWWPAPTVPQPRAAKPARRGLLFGPRKG